MPSNEEKKRRRAIVRGLRRQEHQVAEAKRPIEKVHLAALFRYLDQTVFAESRDGKVVSKCDHTLRLTEEFLRARGSWSDDVREWLGQYGGYCDCEVVFNVADYWLEHM